MFRKLTVLLVLVLLLSLVCGVSCVVADNDAVPNAYRRIEMDKSKIIIDDGDTVQYEGITIRILGLDAPEIKHPQHGIPEDQPFGRAATELARAYIDNAKTVEYIPAAKDKYGRTLAHVLIDGVPLAVLLVRQGLAYETVSDYGDNGFPGYAKEILEAEKAAPVKFFINPSDFRKMMKEKYK
ncbi:MAG: thermonuclease family protein [Chloroflexi bacterium]|nr:thermonuclease family protein [Chloroflexota bacterium]